MIDDHEKLIELRVCCAMLSEYPDDSEWIAKAADLARELFPPLAKALVWVRQDDGSLVAGDYFYKNGEAYWRDEMVFADQAPPGYLYNVAAAKADCEQHNQARFLEQMA